MNRGRFSLESGYQMRPSSCRRCIVSFSYRQPIAGDGCPRHVYIMFGRGFGLVMLSSM